MYMNLCVNLFDFDFNPKLDKALIQGSIHQVSSDSSASHLSVQEVGPSIRRSAPRKTRKNDRETCSQSLQSDGWVGWFMS